MISSILLISLPIATVLRWKAPLLLEWFLPPGQWERCDCQGATRGTIGHEQNTSRMPRLRPYDRWVAADVLLRQEPNEEDEEEDEGDGTEDNDDDDNDDGYSE